MKITVKIGLLFAIIWMIVKISLFGMALENTLALSIATFANMFLLVAAISIGLYLQKRKDSESGNALRDIKNGLTSGIPYAVLVSIFIYFYYEKIDPEFNQHQIAESEIELDKNLNNPAKFKQLQESNPDFEVMTKAQIKKQILRNSSGVYSAKSTAILALLAMTVYSTINSLLITAIYRKIVFKNKV